MREGGKKNIEEKKSFNLLARNIGQISGKVIEGYKIKKNFWPILNKGNEGDEQNKQKKHSWKKVIKKNTCFFLVMRGLNLMRALI